MTKIGWILVAILILEIIPVANAALQTSYNATMVYSSMSLNGTSYPKYRVWSNVTQRWSQEFEMAQNISGNGFMNFTSTKVLAQSNSSRIFAVVLGQATVNNQNNLSLYISNDSGWTWYKEATNFGNVTSAEGTIQSRQFDMAEEPNSTRIMIAYDLESNSNTRDMAYRIWDGSLGAEQYIDFTQWAGTDLTLRHIDLESSPNKSSNEIIAGITSAGASPNHGSYAAVWNGNSWNNLLRISGTAPVQPGMTVATRYESLSYDAIVVANNGSNLMRVCEWKAAGNWNGCNTFDPNSVSGNDNIQALLFADPVSNNITLLNIDDLSDFTIGTWNGTNMTTWLSLDTSIDNTTEIPAFAYNHSNGFAAFFHDTDTTGATLSNRTYQKGATNGASTIGNFYGAGMNAYALRNTDPRSTSMILAMRQNGTSYAITSFNYSHNSVWGTENNSELISSKCTRNFTGIRCYDYTFNTMFNDTAGEAPPATISFVVFTLSPGVLNYSNFTNSMTTNANITDRYIFNTTKKFAEYVPACMFGSGSEPIGNGKWAFYGTCQNSTNYQPLFRIRNTGSVSISIFMNFSADLTGQGIRLCANSSVPSESPATAHSYCSFASKGNLNNSQYIKILGGLTTTNPNYEGNISLWANFTNVGIGSIQSGTLSINSTE